LLYFTIVIIALSNAQRNSEISKTQLKM